MWSDMKSYEIEMKWIEMDWNHMKLINYLVEKKSPFDSICISRHALPYLEFRSTTWGSSLSGEEEPEQKDSKMSFNKSDI